MKYSLGFAAAARAGAPILATVSETRRGAMVNWLVGGAARVMVTNSWTDERIKDEFDRLAEANEVEIIAVKVLRQ